MSVVTTSVMRAPFLIESFVAETQYFNQNRSGIVPSVLSTPNLVLYFSSTLVDEIIFQCNGTGS